MQTIYSIKVIMHLIRYSYCGYCIEKWTSVFNDRVDNFLKGQTDEKTC